MLTDIVLILGNINNSGNLQFVITKPLIIAVLGVFLFLCIGLMGNLISGTIQKIPNREKLLKDIIKYECKEMLYKEINLGLFANERHYVVNKIVMYWREGVNNEHIVVLHTDKGCLVETFFDLFHANDEFIFICNENEAAKEKEGEQISINLFHYKLFDNNLEREINLPGNGVINGNATAA